MIKFTLFTKSNVFYVHAFYYIVVFENYCKMSKILYWEFQYQLCISRGIRHCQKRVVNWGELRQIPQLFMPFIVEMSCPKLFV